MICFESKKPGHFIYECSILKEEYLKRMKKSKKAMVAATWSDNDFSSLEDEKEELEERTNFCLMAKEEEIEVPFNSCDISYDDLQDEYDCLYAEFEKLALKYKIMRKKAIALNEELEKIKYEYNFVSNQRNML